MIIWGIFRDLIGCCFNDSFVNVVSAQDKGAVLPFPPTPSTSIARPRLQDSVLKPWADPQRLPADAPNILIVMIDDVGFGVPDTFGGFAHTPTLSRLAREGICYNRFHTTSICSPSRAALLTGRNHQHVGSGTISERAVIPGDDLAQVGLAPGAPPPRRA